MEINVITGTMIETNNYVINFDNCSVLIEASADVSRIKQEINQRKVLGILLTHGHWDHYINLEKYLKEFSCPVYMTKQAFSKINSKEKAFSFDRNPKVNLENYEVRFIDEEKEIDFGNGLKFEIIFSPGHTNCSVCYLLHAKQDVLFSGDTIFCGGIGRTDLPTGNANQLKNSIKSLLKLKPNTVILPGHGDPTILSEEQQELENIIRT